MIQKLNGIRRWRTPSPNALGYVGRLESYGDVRTCNVSTAGCQISGLLCGQRYNFSVSATDGGCASAQTAPIQLDTGLYLYSLYKSGMETSQDQNIYRI